MSPLNRTVFCSFKPDTENGVWFHWRLFWSFFALLYCRYYTNWIRASPGSDCPSCSFLGWIKMHSSWVIPSDRRSTRSSVRSYHKLCFTYFLSCMWRRCSLQRWRSSWSSLEIEKKRSRRNWSGLGAFKSNWLACNFYYFWFNCINVFNLDLLLNINWQIFINHLYYIK